jgi:arginyl-tRNA synthetase
MVDEKIKQSLLKVLKELNIEVKESDIVVEQSNSLENGDYTTNIAMRLASQVKSNPREFAQKIVDSLESGDDFEKIEIAGPGFINFFLSQRYLQKELKQILDLGGIEYVKSNSKKNERILIEYTDPNPFKMMHIGHLYTNTVGESFARLQESTGAEGKRAKLSRRCRIACAKTIVGH